MTAFKILWLDSETTGLDTRVSHVLDLAWLREYNGKKDPTGARRYLARPVLHSDDKLHGATDLMEHIEAFNARLQSADDPACLEAFSFPNKPKLFTYSKGSLTFNVTPPDIIDPTQWLTDPNRVNPARILGELIADLTDKYYRPGRWTLAGYNVQYDKEILITFFQRILGEEAGLSEFRRLFNDYYVMDVMALVRWNQYAGHLQMSRAKLITAAETLGIDFGEGGAHTAEADMDMSRNVALRLLNIQDEE